MRAEIWTLNDRVVLLGPNPRRAVGLSSPNGSARISAKSDSYFDIRSRAPN
jgi:hypothetical protein